jgi:uncharacterized protein YcfJ
MNRKISIISSILVLASGSGIAHASDFVDNAQVISAAPIVQSVMQQVCQPQTVVTQPPPSQGSGIAGGIIGGLAGGLLGAQVGHGSGKTAATIVGAAGGAIVGNQIATSPSAPTAQTVQTCSNVMHDVVTGYNIVYRYNGRDITTTLPYNPGNYVKVGVGVIDEGVAANPAPRRYRDDHYDQVPPPPPPPGYYR